MKRLILRHTYLCILLAVTTSVSAQTDGSYRHELSFTSDNDAYLMRQHDAYYTNGLFLSFSVSSVNADAKRVHRFELGQKIYTPLIRRTVSAFDIDRPYCGFLYGSYQQTRLSRNSEAVLGYRATLGVVGKASLGEDLQNSYHSLFRYARFSGWKYQVQNALGIDLGLQYANTLWEDARWGKLAPELEASLGMNYTYVSAGFYFCVGAMERNHNSALWNASLQSVKETRRRSYELFAYWHPEVQVQGYNVTVQGGIFSKGDDAVLGDPNRAWFRQSAGLCFATDRLTLKTEVVFEGRETKQQKETQQYAGVSLGWKFR